MVKLSSTQIRYREELAKIDNVDPPEEIRIGYFTFLQNSSPIRATALTI